MSLEVAIANLTEAMKANTAALLAANAAPKAAAKPTETKPVEPKTEAKPETKPATDAKAEAKATEPANPALDAAALLDQVKTKGREFVALLNARDGVDAGAKALVGILSGDDYKVPSIGKLEGQADKLTKLGKVLDAKLAELKKSDDPAA